MMTAEEFFALPDVDELPNPQLIDGELVVSTPAARHQRVIVRLAHAFMLHAEVHPDAGEVGIEIDTLIDDYNVYKPDLWWVPPEQMLDDVDNRYDPPPPLVIEVRSPSTWKYDTGIKLRHYEARGVAEVWLVDTVRDVVRVYRRDAPGAPTFRPVQVVTAQDPLTTPLIPAWEIDLEALFRRT